jgi:hypothetical protein
LAATASLEASASRHAAFDTYQNITSSLSSEELTPAFRKRAVEHAMNTEASAFNSLNLSIQELLDCDTYTDQGCTGGNPLLAFYYIYRHGLASWEEYPYEEAEKGCRKSLKHNPIATVKTWGIITPNHEKHMQMVLRYIGPIAVGFNGASSSFLSYSGGIYDNPHCKQGANHALLITGYGEETIKKETVRYWIARNSWGRGWGEDGFVRIKRGSGVSGVPGVCGISRSPSVALGGLLLRPGNISDYSDFIVEDLLSSGERFCKALRMNEHGLCGKVANWIDYHEALSLGLLGIFCALCAIYPLTAECRKRRRQRRLRVLRREQNRQLIKAENGVVGTVTNQEDQEHILSGNNNGSCTHQASNSIASEETPLMSAHPRS